MYKRQGNKRPQVKCLMGIGGGGKAESEEKEEKEISNTMIKIFAEGLDLSRINPGTVSF